MLPFVEIFLIHVFIYYLHGINDVTLMFFLIFPQTIEVSLSLFHFLSSSLHDYFLKTLQKTIYFLPFCSQVVLLFVLPQFVPRRPKFGTLKHGHLFVSRRAKIGSGFTNKAVLARLCNIFRRKTGPSIKNANPIVVRGKVLFPTQRDYMEMISQLLVHTLEEMRSKESVEEEESK